MMNEMKYGRSTLLALVLLSPENKTYYVGADEKIRARISDEGIEHLKEEFLPAHNEFRYADTFTVFGAGVDEMLTYWEATLVLDDIPTGGQNQLEPGKATLADARRAIVRAGLADDYQKKDFTGDGMRFVTFDFNYAEHCIFHASHLLRACDALQERLCVFLRTVKLLHGQNEQHVVIRAVVHPHEQRIRPLCVYPLSPRGDAVFCAEGRRQ